MKKNINGVKKKWGFFYRLKIFYFLFFDKNEENIEGGYKYGAAVSSALCLVFFYYFLEKLDIPFFNTKEIKT